ncbi:hypothetical protein [Shouchella clausii]|uniref:hypothetical protein n=1 Tax=Shouchella clausii TaxID=79880 RepID=UPI00311F7C0B
MIRNQEWQTVSGSLRGSGEDSNRAIYPDLQDYIICNQMGENATVEELVEENKCG